MKFKMIEIKLYKENAEWEEVAPLPFPLIGFRFDLGKVRVNGVVYTKDSPKFRSAFGDAREKMLMWGRLKE